MPFTSKKIKVIFFFYWFLLLYIIAALVWWYIALNRQNAQMTAFELQELKKDVPQYQEKYDYILELERRKTAQYAGEGATFFLLIVAGAFFVYRAASRELKLSRQQQNFMMAITHELKTPIAIAKINLETLQLRKLDEEKQQQIIHNTLQETSRLNSLCNNMLVSSQIEAGGYQVTNEEINISTLMTECVSDYKIRFPQRKFQSAIQDELFVIGDKMLLQIAINNLVDNAIKYSPKESPITLEADLKSSRVSIRVKDEGKGVEAHEKKKIFDKFYRAGNEATRKAKGTGLGLYLTRKIIGSHKGEIFIKDNTPHGSIFIIELKQVL
ncbi:MAG: two-component sensor histidine kinase [Ferruginibacter sp.]|jgi:K+-sensing histidine kinase KdpD|nr:two-component sensor histidine kinase [Ferruginibacter sp.]